MLTMPKTSCQYQTEFGDDGVIANAEVDARAEVSDELLQFIFDLSKSEDGERWETDGVRI